MDAMRVAKFKDPPLLEDMGQQLEVDARGNRIPMWVVAGSGICAACEGPIEFRVCADSWGLSSEIRVRLRQNSIIDACSAALKEHAKVCPEIERPKPSSATLRPTTPSWAHWCPEVKSSWTEEQGKACSKCGSRMEETREQTNEAPFVRWDLIHSERLVAELERRGPIGTPLHAIQAHVPLKVDPELLKGFRFIRVVTKDGVPTVEGYDGLKQPLLHPLGQELGPSATLKAVADERAYANERWGLSDEDLLCADEEPKR